MSSNSKNIAELLNGDTTVTTNDIAAGSVDLDKLSATGTKDATTYLRGDNTFSQLSTTLAELDDVTVNASDPTASSNKTPVGHVWVNSTSGESYVLTDATTNANVWTNIGDGTGSIPYQIEYLVVAGGGGGGGGGSGGGTGGGGGAGGMRTGSVYATIGNSYTITVGAGGSRGTFGGGDRKSTAGDDSVFGSITSNGGGFAAGNIGGGGDGGSGGGGTHNNNAGGSGTTGQGNDGGNGGTNSSNYYAGGGGGGKSAVGGSPGNSATAGAGGAGLATTITGSSVTYAGGGGGASYAGTGGAGGAGGGASGANSSSNAGTATANRGGGGGGGTRQNFGSYGETYSSNGSSGIVVLKILTAHYTGTTTGSPTVSTDGAHTILTYTSSGSYTG